MTQRIKNYIAGGVASPYRIAKHGTADGQVLQADANNIPFVGVYAIPETTTVALGERADICVDDFHLLEYGGAVTRGDALTSNATGMAITAAPGAGSNMNIIGYADVSGVAGDIVDVYVRPAQIQG